MECVWWRLHPHRGESGARLVLYFFFKNLFIILASHAALGLCRITTSAHSLSLSLLSTCFAATPLVP